MEVYNNNSLFLLEDQVEDEANDGKYDSQSSQDCVEAKESRVDEYLLNLLRNTLWDIYTHVKESHQIHTCIILSAYTVDTYLAF